MRDLVAYWAVAELLGWIALPLTALLFERLPGRGVALARPLALLVAAYPVWLLASLKASPYDLAAAIGGVGVLAGLSALVVWRRRGRGPLLLGWAGDDDAERRRTLRMLGASEAVFALAFLAVVLFRLQVPDVWRTDKPMNLAFLNAIARSDYFPPHDPWAAGLHLNYYYFGHYVVGFVIRIAGVPVATGYNLSLALVFGMAASGAFGVASTLAMVLRRAPWRTAVLAGMLAVVATLALGNVAGAIDFLRHPIPLADFSWTKAVGVFPHAASDFPAFDLLSSDLHAHVMVLPFQLLALLLSLKLAVAGPVRARRRLIFEVVLASLVLGSLYAINSWSFPTMLGMAIAALAIWFVRNRHRETLTRIALVAAAMCAGSLLAFIPFIVNLHPPGGLDWARTQTGIRTFVEGELKAYALPVWVLGWIVAWRIRELGVVRPAISASAAFLLVAVVAPPAVAKLVVVASLLAFVVYLSMRPSTPSSQGFVWLLVASGIVAATITEFVFVRDFSANTKFFRNITVFKLSEQAWVLLAIAAAVALTSSSSFAIARPLRRVWLAGAAVIAAATAVWSLAALGARLSHDEAGPTLDGMRWLERSHPGDAAAIGWMNRNVRGNPVILEAAGDKGLYARVSSYTGLPTVIGSPGHEKQWRNPPPGGRAQDVATIYRTRDPRRAQSLLHGYDVRYVILGPIERATYPGPGLQKFAAIGGLVFSHGGTRVYRVRP